MNKSLILSCVAAIVGCLLPNSFLLGEITIDVDDVFTAAGTTVSLDINATSTGESLLGVDIPLDIGGDGIGVTPAGLTFVGFSSAFDTDSSGGGLPSEDELVGGFNFAAPIALPSAVVTLEFTVDGGVAPGTVFDINVLNNTSLTATDQNFVLSTPSASNGSITISGQVVPEPSSLALCGLISLIGLASRRRGRV